MSTFTTPDTALVAGDWTVDASHSEIGFSARHLMSRVRGSFRSFSGSFSTTEDPAESTISVVIDASSIDTGNAQRDGHLRSADFFDPQTGGEIRFVSTAIAPAADGGWTVTGDLTINGVTRSVDLATEFLGVGVDGYGRTVLGAEATTTINRHDFKVDWNMPLDGGRLLVGPKIDITLTVEAIKS